MCAQGYICIAETGHDSIPDTRDCLPGTGYTKEMIIGDCDEKDFCKDLIGPTFEGAEPVCIAREGVRDQPIFVTKEDGSKVFCDDELWQSLGDYCCPTDVEYADGLCKKETLYCDQGFMPNLQYGCDTPCNPANDSI